MEDKRQKIQRNIDGERNTKKDIERYPKKLSK